jgi:signal transduction histidine kinase
MLKLINSWLKIISTDMSMLKQGFKAISVMTPILKALENVETLAARKNIEIVKSIGEPLPLIFGDDVSLSEAFMNVIGNAIKYSQDGSKVYMTVEEVSGEIKVSVKDSGVGIPPEELPHIFEGFYRGETGQAAASGHGIGLAVTRQIVDAHDGTIAAQSEYGNGTTVIIVLPCHQSSTL